MFKTILVPTDGSSLSIMAIEAAVAFAKSNGSRIVGLSVAEPYPYSPFADSTQEADAQVHEQRMLARAQAYVDVIADAALAAGVPCTTGITLSLNPYEEIIKKAKESACEIIFMASHGPKSLSKLFIGSETQKVLAHSNIPVLVFR